MPVKVKGDKTRVITEAERNSAVKTERLICVGIDQNANKWWNGYVLSNGDAYCEWGRVNKSSQHEYYSYGNISDATQWLEDKSYEKQHKSGGKESYTPQRTISTGGTVAKQVSNSTFSGSSLRTIAAQQIKGDSETKKLVTWLADVNIHQITNNTQITYDVATGAFSTPLGLVTPDGIIEARDILNDLADYVVKNDWENTKYKKYLSDYLRIVPQDVGMKKGWHTTFFSGSDALHKQNDILDSLEAALKPHGNQSPVDNKTEQVFNVSLECVTDQSVISRIKNKYSKEKGSHYDVQHYKVHQVWSVHINTVRDAYSRDGAKLSNIWELWHGSKASNLLSILKSGLIIPPSTASHVCGSMFSRGLYFSDQSTKSIRYATGSWTYGGNIERIFMFIASVGMGSYFVPSGPCSNPPPKGYDSYFAKANKSGVMNNEMVIFRTSQCDLTYLVEFR